MDLKLSALSIIEQEYLNKFVLWCANPENKKWVYKSSSYRLKHLLDRTEESYFVIYRWGKSFKISIEEILGCDFTPFYIHNSQFKQSMHLLNVPVIDKSTVNWMFDFSNRKTTKNHKLVNLD
ncbi:MAG: hypothetical protein ACK5Z5_04925 [Neisseriaceae bacterium]